MAGTSVVKAKENCFIVDGIKIPKGNFAFVYDKLGDREVYKDLLDAEELYRTKPDKGITSLRRAFEGFVLTEHVRLTEAPGQTDPKQIAQLKRTTAYNDYKRQARAGNRFYKTEGTAIFNDSGDDYTEVLKRNFPERWRREDKPDEEETKDLVYQLFDRMYYKLSEVVHPEERTYDECQELLYPQIRNFHEMLAIYYHVTDEFDKFRMPHGDCFPLYSQEAARMDLPPLGDERKRENRFYALSEDVGGQVCFNIMLRCSGKGIGKLQKRQSEVLKILWGEKNRKDPVNVLHSSGDYKEGEDEYMVCSLKSRPAALNTELLGGLGVEERREMLDGVCGSVRSMQSCKPPFYHRHICPSAFIACPSGDSYQLILIRMDFTKDISGDLQGTMYGELQDEDMKGFQAPEVPDFSVNTKDDWAMADIYSMGKVCIYILNGGVLPEPGTEMDTLEKLGIDDEDTLLLMEMISQDPAERPSIKEVAGVLG